ncbi:DNA primase [Thermodesulfitimonas autotrophica]|uniref:DNA primase n=1 Tax=Thermodesulfitimonas autotrophica TaxID=1894989 RepID=UPI002FE1FB6A
MVVRLRGSVPGEFIEEVLSRTDIVALIGEYVRLVKKGQRYVGLCPFHQERTPSFTVSPDKQFFYCFGCGTGGDALKFLILRENLSFPEALRRLADRAGLKLPVTALDPEAERRRREQETVWEINRLVAGYYARQLQDKSGAPARQYLEKRGVPLTVASRFELGFAPASGDALLDFLRRQGVSGEEAVRCGVAIRKDTGAVVDRFRGRLIFPIHDARGRVAGFGGRALDDATEPKYLNSPQTPFFNKRELLYALYQARDTIREKGFAVIVEGYLDAITAHQFGFTNVVASLGTSLTREQARLLLRYTATALIAYDSDTAGTAATLRGLDLLQEAGFEVKVVRVPQGKDPDEFIRQAGKSAWEKLVTQALPLLEYKGIHLAREKGIETAAAKMAVLRELLPNLAWLKTAPEIEEGVRAVAQLTGLSWETVRGELDRFLEKGQKDWLNPRKSVKNKHKIEYTADVRKRAEASLLRLLLEKPSLAQQVEAAGGREIFADERHRRIYLTIAREVTPSGELSTPLLFSRLAEDDKATVAALLAAELPEASEALVEDLIRILREKKQREKRQELLLSLQMAEKAGDEDRVQEILHQLAELLRNRKEGCGNGR